MQIRNFRAHRLIPRLKADLKVNKAQRAGFMPAGGTG
jgi:hypothetical protein